MSCIREYCRVKNKLLSRVAAKIRHQLADLFRVRECQQSEIDDCIIILYFKSCVSDRTKEGVQCILVLLCPFVAEIRRQLTDLVRMTMTGNSSHGIRVTRVCSLCLLATECVSPTHSSALRNNASGKRPPFISPACLPMSR